MPLSITINGVKYNVIFNLDVGLSPPRPQILSVTYSKGPGMAARLGTIHLSPAPVGVISRPCVVTFASGAPSVTVDMLDPTKTFDCTDTDKGTVTASDVNVAGTSPPSAPFSWDAAEVVTSPPPAPMVLGVSFVDKPV